MSDFAPSAPAGAGLDPAKRVNYQVGLVLGVDEFVQDQLHHRERDHHATRALHGYGTVSGLAVSYDAPTGEIRVAPGLAVDALGHLICVPVEYCADLNAWLTNSLDQALADSADCLDEVSAASFPGPLEAYIVLCYDECATDPVPLPSESCLSAEDSQAASRLLESFQLRIVLCEPTLVNELAGGLLPTTVASIWDLLDLDGDSPPDPAAVAEQIKAWVVEERPEVAAGDACLCGSSDCVYLARVTLDVTEDASGRAASDVALDDAARPILLSTRFLQEALLQVAPAGHEHELADLSDVSAENPGDEDIVWFDAGAGQWELRPFEHPHDLGELSDVNLADNAPADGQVLTFDNDEWVAADPAGGGVSAHADLTGLGGDQHQAYLPRNGSRPMTGTLDTAGNRITNVPPSTAAGQPIVEAQAAGGDLTDTYPDPTIARLQGNPVDANNPARRDALIWNGESWSPSVPTLLPFATVRFLGGDQRAGARFEIWLHLEVGQLDGTTDELLVGRDFNVMAEVPTSRTTVGLVNVAVMAGPTLIQRNVFEVVVDPEPRHLRFEFNIDQMEVRIRQGTARREMVRQWAERHGIWFFGQGTGANDEQVVTAFAVNEIGESGPRLLGDLRAEGGDARFDGVDDIRDLFRRGPN